MPTPTRRPLRLQRDAQGRVIGAQPVEQASTARFIRETLRELGMTQRQLASHTGRTQSAISAMIRRNQPIYDTLFLEKIETLKADRLASRIISDGETPPVCAYDRFSLVASPSEVEMWLMHLRKCASCKAEAYSVLQT